MKSDTGEELPIKVSGKDIPLRVGQNITVFYVGWKAKKNGWGSVLLNRSAQRYWFINNVDELSELLDEQLGGSDRYFWFLVFIGFAFVILMAAAGSRQGGDAIFLIFIISVIVGVMMKIVRKARINNLGRHLKKELESLVEEEFDKPGQS